MILIIALILKPERLQRKEYQNEILRLQQDRLGLDATNMYYEAVARANQANNTKH